MVSIPVPAGSANPQAPVQAAAAPTHKPSSHKPKVEKSKSRRHRSYKRRGPLRRFTNAVKYFGKRVRNTVSRVFSKKQHHRRSRRNSLPRNVAVPQDSNAPPGPVKSI